MTNAPERYELFLLDADQKKITWKDDTRVTNTAIFTFNKEDHTLGNLLSQRLHKYDYIQFSAYIVHHPLTPAFDLRVTTDGSVTPKEAVKRACGDIITELNVLSREFTKEWELKKIANMGRDGL
ncbi:DNA-directed RNA polymerase II subunit RPB11a [Tothia fuscella]|uniref:DNA-directed RNA polymerase II subunit RPB11a n=1 Tax=Tothia fuscella TaxID=1048955 RepID=A0A9P4U117_9PEZI|nr:DNA-directed RNA polymerase II subunit RPB11a [Tothia fuscella]